MACAGAARRRILLITSDELGWSSIHEAARMAVGSHAVEQASEDGTALQLAADYQPDLVLMPGRLHGSPTVSLVAGLRQLLTSSASIVVICSHFALPAVAAFRRAGATGCLVWDDLTTSLLPHILNLAVEGSFVLYSRAVAEALVHDEERGSPDEPLGVELTARELLILRDLGQGRTQQQIASARQLSPRTVRRIITHLEQKLAVHNSFTLGQRATQLGLTGD